MTLEAGPHSKPNSNGHDLSLGIPLQHVSYVFDMGAFHQPLELCRPIQRTEIANSTEIADYAFDYYLRVGIHRQAYLSPAPSSAYAGSTSAIRLSVGNAMYYHAIAALGCVWQAQILVIHPTFGRPMDMKKWDDAVRLYSLALAACEEFRKRPRDSSVIEPLQLALMVLFGFEMVTGNHMGCLRYLRYVRAIARKYPEW